MATESAGLAGAGRTAVRDLECDHEGEQAAQPVIVPGCLPVTFGQMNDRSREAAARTPQPKKRRDMQVCGRGNAADRHGHAAVGNLVQEEGEQHDRTGDRRAPRGRALIMRAEREDAESSGSWVCSITAGEFETRSCSGGIAPVSRPVQALVARSPTLRACDLLPEVVGPVVALGGAGRAGPS